MGKFQEWIWLILSLLVLLKDQAFCSSTYYIIEGPQNATVLAGTTARFNCTVSTGWLILIWLFDGDPIVSVLSNGTTIRTNAKYDQQGYNQGTEFTSELKIFDVQPNDSGQIKCSLQNQNENQYAFLSVEVEADNSEIWRTRTIILAVVLSVVGLILLILIILLIIFCCCCERKKESQHRKQTRDAWTLTGRENSGYLPEGKEGAEKMSGIPHFIINNLTFDGPRQHLEESPASDVLYSGYLDRELPSSPTSPASAKKIRNLTHV